MKRTLKFLIRVSAIFIFSSLSVMCAAAQELDISQGSIVITSTGYSVGGETETDYTGEITLTGTSTANTVEIKSGTRKITLNNLNIDVSATENAAAFLISGGAGNVYLSGESTLKSGLNRAGLEISGTGRVNIFDGGNGILNATGGKYGAGIGSGSQSAAKGVITIKSGTVNATGGEGAAGIGSGKTDSSTGALVINGGVITANGGRWGGAGIGTGGDGSSCGTIRITAGTVTATSGEYAAGIGCGDGSRMRYDNRDAVCECGAISISGGDIKAYGDGGAGIGAGDTNSLCGKIYLNGGTIYAYSETDGAGVGAGPGSTCGDITINKCNLTAISGDYGAGIGSGCDVIYYTSVCGSITINSGTVYAEGGNGGAGIGSGYYEGSTCGEIKITGGEVTAIGGGSSAGIGCGYHESYIENDMTISGGTVTAIAGKNSSALGRAYYSGFYGNIYITGGTVYLTCTHVQDAIDTAYETVISGGELHVNTEYGFVTSRFESTQVSSNGGDAVIYLESTGERKYEAYWADDVGFDSGIFYQDKVGKVYGKQILFPDHVIGEGYSLTVPEGAKLEINRGMALVNNGSFHIHSRDSITYGGSIIGNGTYTIGTLDETMIVVPENLVYRGSDLMQTALSKITAKKKLHGRDFYFANESYSLSVEKLDGEQWQTVTAIDEAGTYRAVYSDGANSFSKEFTVAKNYSEAKITVLKPQTRYLEYGEKTTLYANATNLPEGAKIKWKIVDGRGVTLEPSSTGLSCTVTATVDGDAVIEAYLVDRNGNRLKDIDGKTIADREGISSEVNAWMMLIWYFKRIFGLI
ncbi:MAG: hypothetical protein J6J45_01225 [Clostridia bacterium]|nr:hypothetical protein [Clostridia bacterium]